jgi:hypothetical protein
MSALYNALDNALDSFPCSPDAISSLRQAAVRGDTARARRVLQKLDGTLDASKLTDVMHLLVNQGLLPELLRTGLSARLLSPGMQGLWLGAAVSAKRPRDALMLLRAGFHAPIEVVHDIRIKAVRSEPWREVTRALPTDV